MKKQIICVGLCCILIVCMLGVHGEQPPTPPGDLDQSFVPPNYNQLNIIDNTHFYQSFTPSKEKLTKVSLLLSQHNYPSDPQAPIRLKLVRQGPESNGSGYIIAQANVTYTALPQTGYGWVNFTFDSTPVIAEDSHYYLELDPACRNSNYYITWWYSTGNPSPYQRGSFWKRYIGSNQEIVWENYPGQDFIFKTYGILDTTHPIFQLDPQSIDLGKMSKNTWNNSTIFTVTNIGDGILYWEVDPVTTPSQWYFGTQYGFLYGNGASISFNLHMKTPDEKGSYTMTIIFYSNSGILELQITFIVSYADQSCFLAGTKITMADGSYKNIEEIKLGDKIQSYDSISEKIITEVVTNIYHHDSKDEMIDQYLVINNVLSVTSNHPLLVNGKWIEAGKIKTGDTLLRVDQKAGSTSVPISSIRTISQTVPTFNLQISSSHNYIANGMIVSDKFVTITDYQNINENQH
jgi:hypothetical protein